MDSLVCEFVECLMTYLSDTLPDFVQFDIQNCDTKYPNLKLVSTTMNSQFV